MKDSHLINYDIFARRTKFSLRNYLKRNTIITYEEFAEMMRARKVCPPSQDTFEQIKQELQIKDTPEISTIPIEETHHEVVKEEIKTKKRVRRTNKKKSQNGEQN